MKTKATIVFSWIVYSVITANVVFGQGTILLQHTGATDPTSEGFSISGQGLVGPVFNDLGVNAWITQTTNSSPLDYTQMLTPPQQSEIASADWSLSTTIRLVQSGPIAVRLFAGTEGGFFLYFGIDRNGDPTVQAGSSSPVFVLSNAGSTYNNYQLKYDIAANTASLWVNGIQEINGITGDPNFASSSWSILWGQSGQGLPSQANWNLVSLEIIPEPSPAWLFFLGSGILFYVRKRRQTALRC